MWWLDTVALVLGWLVLGALAGVVVFGLLALYMWVLMKVVRSFH